MRKTLRWVPLAVALTLALVALASLVVAGSGRAFAGQDNDSSNTPSEQPHGYSLASVNGSYAIVGTYAGIEALDLGVVDFDGHGNAKGTVLVNQPNPDGSREVVTVGVAGTYSVNSDGTGKIAFVVSFPDGHTANVTEDFVITRAKSQGGTFIATSMTDAQEEPSVVISGDVFVTHVYTRRPD